MRSTHLARLAPLFVATATLALACAGTPPPTPPPTVPPSASIAATPPPVVEEPLAPGELRCGIDDGPVPIGENQRDLRRPSVDFLAAPPPPGPRGEALVSKRMMVEDVDLSPAVDAAKAHATLRWKVSDGPSTPPSFEERARSCRDFAELNDGGAHTFSVKLAAGGGPLSVRPIGSREATKLSSCLAASLCLLGAQPQGAPSRRVDAVFQTKLVPPVFTGVVNLSFVGDRTGDRRLSGATAPMIHDRRGRRSRPAPPPPAPPLTKADLAYVAKLTSDAQEGALACAKRTPPNGQLFVSAGPLLPRKPDSPYKKIDMAMPPPPPPQQRAALAYQTQMNACFAQAVQAVLTPAPKTFSTTGKVFASATYVPGPEAPPPPEP